MGLEISVKFKFQGLSEKMETGTEVTGEEKYFRQSS